MNTTLGYGTLEKQMLCPKFVINNTDGATPF